MDGVRRGGKEMRGRGGRGRKWGKGEKKVEFRGYIYSTVIIQILRTLKNNLVVTLC